MRHDRMLARLSIALSRLSIDQFHSSGFPEMSASRTYESVAKVAAACLGSAFLMCPFSAGALTLTDVDVGAVGAKGSLVVSGSTYTVKGSGADIYNAADAFNFAYQTLTGDGTITARVVSQTNTNQSAKAGVMFRNNLTPGSIHAMMAVTPTVETFCSRTTASGSTACPTAARAALPFWVRVDRAGSTLKGYSSADGTTWTLYSTATIALGSTAYVGLAVTSHVAGTLGTAVFDNVEVTPAVNVSVSATDTSGGALQYRWASTDGTIQNVNSATTRWTLPAGPGLHFAYVLVSNGRGGYTERRVAVNTDTIGSPIVIPPSTTWSAPAGSVQQGDLYRVLIGSNALRFNSYVGYEPQISVNLLDLISGTHYPSSGFVLSDLRGEAIIPGVPPTAGPPVHQYSVQCSQDGGNTVYNCLNAYMFPFATSYYLGANSPGPRAAGGTFTLQDGSPCGAINEFFGVRVTATATLLDAANNVLAGPVQMDEFGDYALPLLSNGAKARLNCEGATAVISNWTTSGGTSAFANAVVPGVTPPTVSSMSATFNGTSIGLFLPPPSGLPSDVLKRADGYLAEKGLDSRLGACQYYKAVGAVKSCDASGIPSGAISFDDWKRAVKIDQYATGAAPEYSATYINKADLNLTRRHFSISYGTSQTAAYVCNHLGPNFALVTAQSAIDTAVGNAANLKNLVACVAMDYSVTPNVNGNQPFTRFLIFGPSGQLLLSVNLDGRREKFVPGTCVVCHGGDHYAGKFPENGSGFANIGAHFLPYDTGNFEFSSAAGLTQSNQELAIYNLNQNVLKAGPTVAEQELISGWYGSGKVLNQNYVPVSWQGQSSVAISFYQDVLARSCRSCHVAMAEPYNFDHYQNIAPGTSTSVFPDTSLDMFFNVCGGTNAVMRDHMMPNSLVTFNRFWLSYQNTSGLPDQPAIFSQFFAAGTCAPGITP